ncbi:hypothetical protein BDW02DRAFT_608536 [Decorospora gaudefroyi]|uniref:DUF3669 domain-containing protein n=1 Tax=Decorospora gaudefroyi TaxID=184978 RepID=A0A6A5KNM1_9PLEO|nr:hypothetical protein BDW02DRAFT_608536 [Decorospora gaudefroyi]
MSPVSKQLQDQSVADASSQAPSHIEKIMLAIQREENLSPKATLNRFLSLHFVISPSPSCPQQQTPAIPTQPPFRPIGAGTCGRIYSTPDPTTIYKVSNHPGQETDQLWNDYLIHTKVSSIWDVWGRDNIPIRVPVQKYYVSATDQVWWDANLAHFPRRLLDTLSNLLAAERIPAVGKPIREALIDMYCPAPQRDFFKADVSNQDCLIRLYLGKRREASRSRFRGFQLRNYTLCVDQMEKLELDASAFAAGIAEALAIVHWACHVDGNDVEFVLGSGAPEYVSLNKGFSFEELETMKPNSSTWNAYRGGFRERSTHVWMLDFNRCAMFEPTHDGLKQLVNSFFRNDPYFPRPHATLPQDRELWNVFRETYLSTSEICIKKGKMAKEFEAAPKLFLDMVDVEQKKRLEGRKAQAERSSMV